MVKRPCRPEGVWGPIHSSCMDTGLLALLLRARVKLLTLLPTCSILHDLSLPHSGPNFRVLSPRDPARRVFRFSELEPWQSQEAGVGPSERPELSWQGGCRSQALIPTRVCSTKLGVSFFHVARSPLCFLLPWDRARIWGERRWTGEEVAPPSRGLAHAHPPAVLSASAAEGRPGLACGRGTTDLGSAAGAGSGGDLTHRLIGTGGHHDNPGQGGGTCQNTAQRQCPGGEILEPHQGPSG